MEDTFGITERLRRPHKFAVEFHSRQSIPSSSLWNSSRVTVDTAAAAEATNKYSSKSCSRRPPLFVAGLLFLLVLFVSITLVHDTTTSTTAVIYQREHKKCFREGIRYFQVYHISKCGGTNMQASLTKIFHIDNPKTQDKGWWRKKQENEPDERYHRDPNSTMKQETFVLGLIRSPFGYYRSLYAMHTASGTYPQCKTYFRTHGKHGTLADCQCSMKVAYEHGLSWLYETNAHMYNVSAFGEWLEFMLETYDWNEHKTKQPHCIPHLQYIFHHMMHMNDGSMAYDAVVRQENYYPTLREALEQVRPCVPSDDVVIDFSALDQLENDYQQQKRLTNARQAGPSSTESDKLPDYCFYPPKLRKLVEEKDHDYIQRFNYTWENFVGHGSVANDCAKSRESDI